MSVAGELTLPMLAAVPTTTAAGFEELMLRICVLVCEPKLMYCPTLKSVVEDVRAVPVSDAFVIVPQMGSYT